MEATPFDRVAEIYDETRGGEERGHAYAVQLSRLLAPNSDLFEIGVGTGLVARPLAVMGHSVLGVDLSRPMLTKAAFRIERSVLLEADAAVLGPKLGRTWDRSATLAPRLEAHGFNLESTVGIDDDPYETTPNEQAARLERRVSSSLWDLETDAWNRVVQPIIDRLRALPQPDRPRRCRHTHELARYRLQPE